jgi:hypothetical protein
MAFEPSYPTTNWKLLVGAHPATLRPISDSSSLSGLDDDYTLNSWANALSLPNKILLWLLLSAVSFQLLTYTGITFANMVSLAKDRLHKKVPFNLSLFLIPMTLLLASKAFMACWIVPLVPLYVNLFSLLKT